MLSLLQQKKLNHLFALSDLDRSGTVELADLEMLADRILTDAGRGAEDPLREGAAVLVRHFWEQLQALADTDGDGRIDLQEWMACWGRQLADADGITLDADFADLPPIVRQGHLLLAQALGIHEEQGADPQTYARFLAAYDPALAAQAAAVFPRLDLDGNGVISLAELEQLTAEFFLAQEGQEPGNLLFGPLPA